MPEQPKENGKRIEMIEDIATLKNEIKHITDKQDLYHKEVKDMFEGLTDKVNHQMTSMNAKIDKRTRQFIKWGIIVIIVGSFLWIKESRDLMLRIIGFVV